MGPWRKSRYKNQAAKPESVSKLFSLNFYSWNERFTSSLLVGVWIFLCSGCVSGKFFGRSDKAGRTGKNGYYYYQVKKGDSLWNISRGKGVDFQTLIQVNHLRNPDHLEVGQKLRIPNDKQVAASRKSPLRSNPIKPQPKPKGPVSKTKNTPPQSVSNSKMIFPIQGDFTVTSRFGMRNGRMHRGVDLSAPAGTPVVAVLDGVVNFTGTEKDRLGKILGFGNYIYLSHPGGLYTVYAHNRVNLVKSEQKVKQGQVIAEVGNTGDTQGRTGNHLHFEVRNKYTAEAYNPEKYLPPLK